MAPVIRLAVLIDADNISDDKAEQILTAVARYGKPAIKRAYGDWSKRPGWKETARRHGIKRIEQPRYVRRKNATDIALAVGAMDLLHSSRVDGFVLVSSDSDFTPLVKRLREAGKLVYGVGRSDTPRPLVAACDEFSDLDPEGRLRALLSEAIAKTASRSGWARLCDVGQHLDTREYGRALAKFVRAQSYLEVKEVPGQVLVRLRPSSP